ncbi:hypothetical protein LZK73_21760 [Neorhizobium galegae]|nr:hypothetical protein LZK73_21760 [Neorhizobium galegae]
MSVFTQPMDVAVKARHSFADHLAKEQAAKFNSDMANLASAYAAVEAQIIELERIKRNIEQMASKIEAGEVFSVEDVRKLYQEAQSAGRCL